jgi:hypothetical protein
MTVHCVQDIKAQHAFKSFVRETEHRSKVCDTISFYRYPAGVVFAYDNASVVSAKWHCMLLHCGRIMDDEDDGDIQGEFASGLNIAFSS